MPVSKRRLVLSRTADRDYRNMLHFSEQRWGKRQRSEYRALIKRALRTITTNPEIGKPRDDLADGLWGYVVNKHIVVYRITSDTINVARILHERQRTEDLYWDLPSLTSDE